MDAIEKAIRNALEKGNAEDRAFREKVYRSAFAALDRALQANPGVTVEVAIKRRKAIQATITEIESEFLPAVRVGGWEVDARAAEPGAAAAPGAPAAPGAAGAVQRLKVDVWQRLVGEASGGQSGCVRRVH